MNLFLVKDKLPLSGTDNESIISTIAKVLKLDNVVRLNVDARTSTVDFWRVPNEAENDGEPNPFKAVLRRVQMEEYSPDSNESGERQFLSMCEIIEDAGCFPVFILIGGSISKLREWVPFPRRSTHLAGIPILNNPDIHEDVILMCGAKTKEAEPIDITFVVKMTLL